MMSISRKKTNKFIYTFVLLLISFFAVGQVDAQSLSLSITPTIVEMTAEPEQVWEGSIKVINNNDFPLEVYASVVNFAPQGEYGQSTFLPLPEGGLDNATLAEWLTVPEGAIEIDSSSSQSVPVRLNVPEDASPGGHYAAVQVGTRPPEGAGAPEVKTSQVVTSLFFIRIEGDVVESANIRSFRAHKKILPSPSADFELRFENKGNVHLQPQGEIVIKNMWGAERGVVPINNQTLFGKVLPDMIRAYNFSWEGAFSFSNIGRYTAEIALSYGVEKKQFVNSTAVFWVIPVKQFVLFLLVLAGLVYFVRFVIRMYVRRMLVLAGVDPDMRKKVPVSTPKIKGADLTISAPGSVKQPLVTALRDFKIRVLGSGNIKKTLRNLCEFVLAYKLFFICLVVAIFIVALVVWYIGEAKSEQLPYQVTYENLGDKVEVSSDKIIYEKNKDEAVTGDARASQDQDFTIRVVNVSGVSGLGAEASALIEDGGVYLVDEIDTELSRQQDNTSIVYPAKLQKQALELSQLLDNALLSSSVDDENEIVIYIGSDLSI